MKIRQPIVIHEDDHLIIVNKPPGLLSINDRFDQSIPNLFGILKRSFEELYIVHRLDQDTTGAIIFAKTKQCQVAISTMLEKQEISKHYLVLVQGVPEDCPRVIDAKITKDPKKKGRMMVYKKGKDSQSMITLLESFDKISLLEVKLLTGRTHQIRVHLAHIGHPLLVDKLYSSNDAFFLSSLKPRKYRRNKTGDERALMDRQSLHSHRLKFNHPFLNEILEVEADLPKDFKAVLNQLRKNN